MAKAKRIRRSVTLDSKITAAQEKVVRMKARYEKSVKTLELLISNGINARPTGKQTTITISVTEAMKERLVDAGLKLHRTTTSILVEAGEAWLDSHDC